MNWFKTFLLMAVMTALVVVIGQIAGGQTGMIYAFVFAGLMNFVSYWFSDKIVLAMYRAKPITESESPEIYSMIRRLTERAGIPMPKVYSIDIDTPNAFATGRNPAHAAVAVTTGLMRILDQNEIEGVIAHELAHVKNRDILIGTIAATMAGAIMMLGRLAQYAAILGGERRRSGIDVLLLVILAPIAALMIQMAISRSREYQADATGAEMARNPMGLANALMKLERGNEIQPAEAVPATAHMFIVNPLKGGGLLSLFSTHPPIADRVARLRTMGDRPAIYR